MVDRNGLAGLVLCSITESNNICLSSIPIRFYVEVVAKDRQFICVRVEAEPGKPWPRFITTISNILCCIWSNLTLHKNVSSPYAVSHTNDQPHTLSKPTKMPANSHQPAEPGWLAKPSGDCCLKGHLHAGSPQGSFERLAEMETYVSQPPKDKANGHIVLYYPDVFGFFTNGLLVMDSFAAAGYLAIGIDYFQGVSDRSD